MQIWYLISLDKANISPWVWQGVSNQTVSNALEYTISNTTTLNVLSSFLKNENGYLFQINFNGMVNDQLPPNSISYPYKLPINAQSWIFNGYIPYMLNSFPLIEYSVGWGFLQINGLVHNLSKNDD